MPYCLTCGKRKEMTWEIYCIGPLFTCEMIGERHEAAIEAAGLKADDENRGECMNMAICAVCMEKFTLQRGKNERVCQGCLKDAKLGRLVRSMPERMALLHFRGGRDDERNGRWAVDEIGAASPEYLDTPEAALIAAEVKEGGE